MHTLPHPRMQHIQVLSQEDAAEGATDEGSGARFLPVSNIVTIDKGVWQANTVRGVWQLAKPGQPKPREDLLVSVLMGGYACVSSKHEFVCVCVCVV